MTFKSSHRIVVHENVGRLESIADIDSGPEYYLDDAGYVWRAEVGLSILSSEWALSGHVTP